MVRSEIIIKLHGIFSKIFKDPDIKITDELSANDVPAWDSLSHMTMISTVEEAFGIKFKLKDLNKMKNVGDLIMIIQTKL